MAPIVFLGQVRTLALPMLPWPLPWPLPGPSHRLMVSDFHTIVCAPAQAFGGFALRERQNSRVRVEIDATDPATNQVGPYIAPISYPYLKAPMTRQPTRCPPPPRTIRPLSNQRRNPSDPYQRRRFAAMFAAVEAKKTELKIQEYSIAQTSLEQIFNQFAAQQEEEKGPAGGGAGLVA